jgi:two-component system, chemotaxis family, sensor kinase Cph1
MGIAATPIELTVYGREPIHVPDSIQPHGMMLVAEQESFIVRHGTSKSDNRPSQRR